MRVITGSARGRRLSAPAGLDVRPTADKVKEAVFSVVQFDLAGSAVLDLFAGSGQLGIEALSRGAKSCVFVDSSRVSVETAKENIAAAGFKNESTVMNSDAEQYLRMCRQAFDIAFIDPPYKKGLIEKVMPLLCGHMSDRGIAVCEHEKGLELPESFGELVKSKTYRYGKTEVTLYRQRGNEEELE
ncbi:MAG: 16S rRNA (guanine(966)-N(2))-methyltransferase RsmD [Ruminococcus sp.]|nr:16S rRNA (guanine(966)-N(2))-methyltransferase RsmD [Ruminococcus sp.]